jgi:predicted nucleic acid-binding protein
MSAIAIDCGALVKALVSITTGQPPIPGSLNETLVDYLVWQKRMGVRILIPAPALAEVLAFFQFTGQHDQCIAAVREIAEVVPFDFRAAAKAAELWKLTDGRKFRDDLIEKYRSHNQCVKVDYQIAAASAVHGAIALISFDTKHLPDICQLVGLQCLGPADLVLPQNDQPRGSSAPGHHQPSLFGEPTDQPPP